MITPTSINNSATVATPLQAGQNVAAQISLGQGVEVTSNTASVRILPISLTANSQTVSTTATVTTVNGQTLSLVLKGTSNQVANAAGFIAAATSAELSGAQIQTGTSIALSGANYTQVVALINSLSGLMIIATNQTLEPKLEKGQPLSLLASSTLASDPRNKSESNSKIVQNVTIEPVRLNRAIFIFNQILDTSDDATVTALSRNQEFITIGQVLKRLSSAFNN
ncbi:hypothetical protein [Cylindrospermopsis curvispora]|uniref:Uncharacterized protein n=1 Tax=Cylindrospermopsis curvispora GIHE-G1 TaxID=2666332 RepID=A0A7H0F4N1_9CYAN|nr:hypothetical protein [Cylindrospermopsis curvispora]QNP30997.1 hypothetical protein IAR63_08510 [Cylindrospermopsis curvispora GIHE-G1]